MTIQLNPNHPLMTKRPFRAPGHGVTQAALLGGGRVPRPGEVTLSGKGVLFLDELTEYRQTVLEGLREPLEEKKVILTRLTETCVYPADFMLAAAMNPCRWIFSRQKQMYLHTAGCYTIFGQNQSSVMGPL